MSIIEDREFVPLAHEDDPDDYRPDSELAVVLDPTDENGEFVSGLTVLCERIAPGDGIPLHQHTLEEVFFVDEGRIEATVGDDRDIVGPGVTVFIPARTPHGFRNVGDEVARVHAVFPDSDISIRYLERNPAPGTEGDPPGPPVSFDMRELVEGDPEQAVRPVDVSEFSSPGGR